MTKHTLFACLAVATLIACPGCSPDACGSWGGGSCGPVGPLMPPMPLFSMAPRSIGFEWRVVPSDPDQLALYANGVQLGNYIKSQEVYKPLVNGQWGDPCDPPYPLPEGLTIGSRRCGCCRGCQCPKGQCRCQSHDKCCPACDCHKAEEKPEEPAEPKGPIFGVEPDKIQPGKHILDGREVTKKEIIGALSDVPKDQDHGRLTVIGPDAEREAVLKDLASSPDFAGIRDKVLIQDYPPDHWAVKDAGFDCSGHPSIVYQAPNGDVLHSQKEYVGGAKALAEAIRKADADRDPKKDPDRRQPDVIPSSLSQLLADLGLDKVPPIVWVAGVVVLVVYLHNRKKKGQ